MDEDLKTRLEEAKNKVVQAELEVLDIYFSKVRESYTRGNDFVRKRMLSDLTSFVESLDDLEDRASRGAIFDSKIAKNIRTNSLRELSEQIGVCAPQLSRYESGERVPVVNVGSSGRKYLDWLKSQGYNPYNL